MQYGLDVGRYERVKEDKGRILSMKERPIVLIGILLGGILISRVTLFLNKGNISGIAPFGIAYLVAMAMKRGEKKWIWGGAGVFIGYLTITNNMSEKYVNLLAVAAIVAYCFISDLLDFSMKEFRLFSLIFMSYFIYGLSFSGYDLGINLTLALINTVVAIPIYYVIRYGVSCIEEFKSNYFFSTEEIISMGILLCLVVSGIGNVGIAGISVRNIFAYAVVLCVAFIGGGTHGAAIGVSMGIIIGINTGDMTLSIAFYSMAGLIAGVFKDTGKFFALLAYLVMYLALAIYSKDLNVNVVMEVVLAGIIFMIIPKEVYRFVEIEMNSDKKKDLVNEMALKELKLEFTEKVRELGTALNAVSKTLSSVGNNEKLMYKDKSTALIENLTDRVCSTCCNCSTCWNRDFNVTYNSFQTLIRSCEENQITFPSNLEKVCLNKFELIKGAEKIVGNLNNNEVLKGRLEEGRLILATHVRNISDSIGEMLTDFNKGIELNGELDRLIRRGLNKHSIPYNNIFCYRDTNGREKIKISLSNTEGDIYWTKKTLPIVTELMKKPMCIAKDGCRINPETQECTLIFEETPKYYVKSYAAMVPKEGEDYTGDTYSFGSTNSRVYSTLISDGMGSGPDAGKESKATVELVEKFIESGFEKSTSINMVNSIMAMKFEEDEKFSTLDLNLIDLYSGEVSFIKVGAVASFIKRGKEVKTIMSNMPPFGLVDNVDVEEVKSKVRNGDIIITLSDGVLDIDKKNIGQYNWIEEYLKGACKDPKQLAGDIIDKAKTLSGGKSQDDMTVVVSKVYSLY